MKKFFTLFLITTSPLLFTQQLQEFRAVKLTNVDSNVLFTDQNIAQAMDYLASVNINAVLVVVWHGAHTLYPSQTMDSLFSKPIHPNFVGRDVLERVVIEAHRNGIEVYPWFEYGFAAWYSGNNPPHGGHIIQSKPDWACRLSNGQIAKKNGFDWMSAIHPEVQDFMNKLIIEVMKYDIDGIEFSDRIPAMPIEGGYEPYTVSLYQSENNGQNPPINYNDVNWKRWRANKMNQWYKNVRQIMKNHSQNLFVSTSPSIYPWGYDNYLQDVQTWLDSGICDQYIPQLYRYTFSDYLYELNRAVSQSMPNNLNKLFAGILMNIGQPPDEYIISPDYLLSAIQANRQRGVMGEAYFYYEGFRKNNNKLGDTLRATYYSQPALMPGRNGNVWRPKAVVKNENDNGVNITGSWTTYPMAGFNGQVIRTNQTSQYASIEYTLNVPFNAHFDLYAYLTPNTSWTQQARYVLYTDADSTEIIIDQSNLNKKGWQKIGTVYLTQGMKKVLKIDNTYLENGRWLVADAMMIMINRKLSPNVVVTDIEDYEITKEELPTEFRLEQNYPNPFNSSTKIRFAISTSPQTPLLNKERGRGEVISLKVLDVLGREVTTLVNEEKPAGIYEVEFDASKLSSGIYFYQLRVGEFTQTKKMILMR
jgi:uncharacterized lipoprotein YddW (UPF0748 family)